MYFTYMNMVLHYHSIGSGKPMFILHGLGCDYTMMKSCMEPIMENTVYQRIYIDLPGMGKSGACKDFASADKIVEVLIAFIDSINKENFLLVGESYGGYLARGILSKKAKQVDGMMLLCPVIMPEPEKRRLPAHCVSFCDEEYLATLTTKDRENFMEYAVIANRETYQRYQNEIMTGIKLANHEFINLLQQNYALSFDVDAYSKAKRFDKPVLILCGRQDCCVGYQDASKIIEEYSRATFVIIDKAGHNLQIEQPELFSVLVKDWLMRV